VQIEAAGVAWLNQGGRLAFLTLTLPHDLDDSLAATLGAVRKSWKAVQQDKAVRAIKAENVRGFVRATENTRGELNGWHPHLHVLLFLEGGCGPDAVEALRSAIESAWRKAVVKQGFRVPSWERGVNLQAVEDRDGGKALCRYLTKVQDEHGGGSWGVGAEMTRGDLKVGKRPLSRTPFEILDGALAGVEQDRALWHEYEQATKGLRVIEASRHLFRDLGVLDVSDDDVCEPGEAEAQVVALITAQEWAWVVRYRACARVLFEAEQRGGSGVLVLLESLRQRALAGG